MTEPTFPDEWLAASLEGVVDTDKLAQARAGAGSARTLWEALVLSGAATDEQILTALSTRSRSSSTSSAATISW